MQLKIATWSFYSVWKVIADSLWNIPPCLCHTYYVFLSHFVRLVVGLTSCLSCVLIACHQLIEFYYTIKLNYMHVLLITL
jgi:hypothetical protein